jgi:diaminopimelate decarboxylase
MQALEVGGSETVDIVGPICEGTDYFAKDRAMPPVARGDLVAVFSAGAYGYTMAGNYNARPMCPEVLVDGDQYEIIRKRQTYDCFRSIWVLQHCFLDLL